MEYILRITQRDFQILVFIHAYGSVTLAQVRRRYFPTSRSPSPCAERIARLVRARYLLGHRLPAQKGVGSGKLLLTLGRQGRTLVRKALGVTVTEMRRVRASAPLFLAHHLMIGDIRLSLEMATERSAVLHLADWADERQLRRHPIRVTDVPTGERLTIVPDASFSLAVHGNRAQGFVLEVDMGTMAPKRLRRKLRAYLGRQRALLPVLFVVPDAARQRALSSWTLQEAAALGRDPTLFWITTQALITPATILTAPIWQIVGGPPRLAIAQLVGDRSTPHFTSGTITFRRRTFS